MKISYGAVDFTALQIRTISRKLRLSADGTTYLWTDWVIDVVCIYNPKATSFTGPGVPIATPAAGAGEIAPMTDNALRHYLAQPRRRLQISDFDIQLDNGAPLAEFTILDTGGTVTLASGAVVQPPDCDNGPKCTVQAIEVPHGVRTYQCHLVFEAAVNECSDRGVQKLLLSHRWARSEDVNEDCFSTIHTYGECVFNLKAIVKDSASPDQFRAALFHPIPANFQRKNIRVEPQSDGYTYKYYFCDEEQAFNLGSTSPAMRIECNQTGGFSRLGAASASLVGVSAGIDAYLRLEAGQMANPANIAFIPFAIGTGANIAAAVAVAGWNATAAQIPHYSLSVEVTAYGNRNSTRGQLRARALAIIAHRLSMGPLGAVGANLATQEFSLHEDFMRRIVHVRKTIKWGIEQIIAFNLNASFLDNLKDFLGVILPGFGLDANGAPTAIVESFVDETLLPGLGPNTNANNPQPQFGAHSTVLVNVIAQALSNPCELPPTPSLPVFQNKSLT